MDDVTSHMRNVARTEKEVVEKYVSISDTDLAKEVDAINNKESNKLQALAKNLMKVKGFDSQHESNDPFDVSVQSMFDEVRKDLMKFKPIKPEEYRKMKIEESQNKIDMAEDFIRKKTTVVNKISLGQAYFTL